MALNFFKLREELSRNPSMMIDDLAKKIGETFGVRTEVIKRLLQEEATESRVSLRKELAKNFDKGTKELSDEELEKLLVVIAWGKDLIKNLSRKEIEELKIEVTKFTPSSGLIEKYLPQNLITRAKVPIHLGDHITWACLGIVNSAQKIVELLFMIGKWILMAPYHIYLIVNWEWECDTWERL